MIGRSNPKPLAKVTPDTILTFSYTSGTTGDPKGAMLNHRNFVSNWCGADTSGVPKYEEQLTHLCFLPLPHLFERSNEFACIHNGHFIAFYGGNVLKLMEDIQFFKPDILALVPRLINRFYSIIHDSFQKLPEPQRSQVLKAVQIKLENLHKTGSVSTRFKLTKSPRAVRQIYLREDEGHVRGEPKVLRDRVSPGFEGGARLLQGELSSITPRW